MAKKVAPSIAAVATFMPKPFSEDFRSGAHFNMSLADAKTGAPLFAPGKSPGKLASRYGTRCSDLALHFIAGLKRHAPAITAVTCPSYNSSGGDLARFGARWHRTGARPRSAPRRRSLRARQEGARRRGFTILPRMLLHALEAFEADPLSGKAFGDFYRGIYLSHKHKEWEQTFYRVTDEQPRALLTFI
jgi:glutamine synthetase